MPRSAAFTYLRLMQLILSSVVQPEIPTCSDIVRISPHFACCLRCILVMTSILECRFRKAGHSTWQRQMWGSLCRALGQPRCFKVMLHDMTQISHQWSSKLFVSCCCYTPCRDCKDAVTMSVTACLHMEFKLHRFHIVKFCCKFVIVKLTTML